MFIPDPDLDFLLITDPGQKRHRIQDPDPQHWYKKHCAGISGFINKNAEPNQYESFIPYLLLFRII
jgi:hypothetical protein